MKLPKTTLITALILGLSVPASAALLPLTADMDGAQANNGIGTGSPGTGSAVITLDTSNNTLSWYIIWSDLIGTPTAMHFHGPAGPGQKKGGIAIDVGITGPPVSGNAVLSAGQVVDLLDGLWYLNLHTTQFPGGEIRGAVVNSSVAAESQSWGSMKALFR